MGKLAEIFPIILRVFSRARVLSGAVQSRTTKDQWLVLTVIAFIVSTAAQFVPALGDESTAIGLVMGLMALLGPAVARMLNFDETAVKPVSVLDIPSDLLVVDNADLDRRIVRVRGAMGGSWSEFKSNWKAAAVSGWVQGVLDTGEVVNLFDGTRTGHKLRLPDDERGSGYTE